MQRLFAKTATVGDAKMLNSKKEDVIYVSYKQITPGQIRYSSLNADKKVKKHIAKGNAILDEKTHQYKFKHGDGRSVFSKKKALDVIKTKDGWILLDGHHDVMSSIQLGAEMIPIKVKIDRSQFTTKEFLATAEADKFLYLYDTKNLRQAVPSSFTALVDDPNRYFAALVARKYDQVVGGGYTSTGLDFPLWVKIGKDIPFIEFKIANALYAQQFTYDAKSMGNPPRDEIIEKARGILLAANVPELLLIPKKTLYSELNINFQTRAFQVDAKAAINPVSK